MKMKGKYALAFTIWALTMTLVIWMYIIKMVGRYGQGHHTPVTLMSQGQIQGHKGHCPFLPIFRISAQECSLGPYAKLTGIGILHFCPQGQILTFQGQTLK